MFILLLKGGQRGKVEGGGGTVGQCGTVWDSGVHCGTGGDGGGKCGQCGQRGTVGENMNRHTTPLTL